MPDNDKAGQQRPSIKAAMFAELPPEPIWENIATPMPVQYVTILD